MKAPDKIYLHKIRDEESSGYHKMWFETRARCVPSEEYIRKKALMEWAEAFKAKTGWYEIEVAMDDLIDKLNSM